MSRADQDKARIVDKAVAATMEVTPQIDIASSLNAPSVPVLPLDMPSVSKSVSTSDENIQEPSPDCDENQQCWTQRCSLVPMCVSMLNLSWSVGPALRLTTKGVALTPIRMTNLDDDKDGGKEGARKYLVSCKSVRHVAVDGRPGLCLHQGRCHLWTAVEVTPEVVRAKPCTF